MIQLLPAVTSLSVLSLMASHALGDTSDDINSLGAKCAILEGTNYERSRYGLPPLVSDKRLDNAAMMECQGLLKIKFLSHTADGDDVGGRTKKSGYRWMGAGKFK